MLPTNVMSFMKKMVATEGAPGAATTDTNDTGTTFGKLKQTLSSSLLTAQDKVVKMSPRPSLIPDLDPVPPPEEKPPTPPQITPPAKPEPGKPPSRAGACRVCLKAFKPEDFSRTCAECKQRVCEDCASYSKLAEDEDPANWTCSVCRRKLQSRTAVAPTTDSNESLLDIPIQELQRRHSEARLGSSGGGGMLGIGSVGSGLAPPRSPDLRRHSDVSPASLKEIEKLKGGGSKTPDPDWSRGRGGGRSTANSRANSPPKEQTTTILPPTQRSRRGSRVARQHSYDEEVKNSIAPNNAEPGLGLPAPMPRRASAYDVYAVQGLNAAPPAPPLGRRASFRVAAPPEPPSPPSPESGPPITTLMISPEEDRRTRRRGSQLPDIAILRTIPPPRPVPALEDLEATPRRQASVDAEAIRIIIHDVDSGATPGATKRVLLRRDPTDKQHRTRGYGMRVVGGKTAADGRLFAYVVWVIQGSPAEKCGIQQGDRVLEWGGVSLIDRSFEEVCAIMDRTGDVVELLIEHATDMKMSDWFDEPMPSGCLGRKQSEAVLTALQEPEADKTPSSPTRRKLPKTPV